MARHLGKIIKILKAEKQLDMFDSEHDKEYEAPLDQNAQDWEKVDDTHDLKKFILKYGNLKESQYIDAMAGDKKGTITGMYIKDAVNNWAKEHNTPQVNKQIFDLLKKHKEKVGDKGSASLFNEAKVDALMRFANIPEKTMGEAIESGDERVLDNPNFNKNHLYRMAEKHPKHLNRMLANEHFDDKLTEKFFGNPESLKNMDSSTISSLIGRKAKGYHWNNGDRNADEDQSLELNPRVVHAILDHAPDKISQSHMNILLDHADPTFKKQWTDKALGIADGKYSHTDPSDYEEGVEDPEFKEENWNNWSEGGFAPEFNRVKNYLASSRHLDDDQAEHIKRNGDFEDKYDLYHNKYIDPKHGVEMFQKWHDDDSHHEYNAEDLVDKYKEDKDEVYTMDDLDESTIEEIRQEAYDSGIDYEHAEQNYPFEEWVDDNEDKIIKDMGSDHDDMDEIYEKLHENYDDWTAENSNSSQNEGNPTFDALNKLHEEFEDGHITLDELKETTGIESWKELGLEPDSDGDVHSDDVKEELDKFGGPLQIDYSNHDDFNISDHPEYEDRYEEAAQDWRREKLRESPYDFYDSFYEGWHDSDQYREAANEAVNNYVEENAKEHMDNLYDNSHQDTRFIPEHLHAHIPNFDELHEQNKKRLSDGGHSSFFDSRIKDRSYDHEYGEDQHYYEMVKDHAEANGGSIDVGTMNKLYPNQKEKWKKIFSGKGKISHDEASQKLNELPKTKYDISYGKWDGTNMQNVNGQNQIIFRLDHSSESLKPLMEDSSLYDTFKKVQNVSKQSGHPTKDNTIAWARVDTTDPKHWMIDEVQSDFGKTVTRYLKEQGAEDKAGHIDKISAHHKNWRENLTNAVLKEARKHGAEKVSTHSPESKANHTGASTVHSVYKDSYQKVPRQMGFQPTHAENLPLTDKGKEHFKLNDEDPSNNLQGHTYNLTPSLLKKHMDDCLEYLEALEKGEMLNAAKGAVLALGLGMGTHYMGQDAKQQASDQFAQDNIPKHARSMASIDNTPDPKQEAYESAKKEANNIIYKNDKNWFLKKYSDGLSPHVYKQTIKQNPELSSKYDYINSLSNNAFKEVIQKNPHLRNDVHAVHYDKLHNEFGGDHEKMLHAWKNGVKATNTKFGRSPSNVENLGEHPSQDTIDDTISEAPEAPNFTHRRMFRGRK